MTTQPAPTARAQPAFPVTRDTIREAADLLAGRREFLPGRSEQVAAHTPLVWSDTFSHQFGCRVWLKLENLQRTGSYKVRGAFNNIANLPPGVRERGVVTASAGNHAQGVGYAARVFGIHERTTIYVPVGTPKVKQENTRGWGVEVRETGENFDLAREAAYREAGASGRAFIEPFDAWATIAGQGTIGLEILDDLPSTRAIIAPCGGGGMIAGVAIAAFSHIPPVAVIGVQAEGARGMLHSLEQDAPTELTRPPFTQIADGIKVRRPGDRPFEVVRALVGLDHFMTVADPEIVAAVADLMVYSRVMAEGAGAVGIAALRRIQGGGNPKIPLFGPEDDVVVIVSGGNIDPSFSGRILYEQTVPNLMTIRVSIPDRPGELLRMLVPIASANVNIIDVDVNRLDARPRMGERVVEICVAVTGRAQADALLEGLAQRGLTVQIARWVDPADYRAGIVNKSTMASPDVSAGGSSR